jgi:protein SCO1/2
MKTVVLRILIFLLAFILVLAGCKRKLRETPFLELGEWFALVGGKKPVPLPYYKTVPAFAFVNQDSVRVTDQTFAGRIYVAEFFFTSCRAICPRMNGQMRRLYDKFENIPRVMLLSHTINPAHDSVAVLREYARRIGVRSDRWHFVTGDKAQLHALARSSYLTSVVRSPQEPGGLLHSGAFILVDTQRRVRGVYDGTSQKDVDRLMEAIETLLDEAE